MNIIAGILAGYIAHQIDRPTRQWFGDGDICRIAQYVQGGLLLFINFQFFRKKQRDDAFVLSLFSSGVGVVLGYILDLVNRKR